MLNNIQIIHKKIKHINLKVKPNLEVILSVPLGTTQTTIKKVVSERTHWIQEKLEFFKQNITPTKELVSGELISYLGRNYRLKIHKGNTELVELCTNGYLNVTLKDTNNLKKKHNLIDKWYKEKAIHHFSQIIEKYTRILNKSVNKVTIRKMKTRWGSCNPQKSYINLNLELIKKDILSIEYVILHELAHLTHYNHDKKFYGYVATYMPDWKIRKKMLA